MKNEVYIKIIYLILIAFFSTSGIVYPNFTKIVIDSTLYICWGLDCEDIDLDNDTDIIVETQGETQTSFSEFVTADGNYCFKLHNNYNIPNVIPVFQMNKK